MPTKSQKTEAAKPKTKPQTRKAAVITPDSVAKRRDTLPDDPRVRDQVLTPDSLPPVDEQEELSLSPDGGSPDHPTHDEPMEDMEPEDFEAQIDGAQNAKLEKHVEDEIVDPRVTREFASGSSDPLDDKTRAGKIRIPNS